MRTRSVLSVFIDGGVASCLNKSGWKFGRFNLLLVKY